MDKPISHFKRCHTRLVYGSFYPNRAVRRQVRKQVFNERSNSYHTILEWKTIDRADEMKPYKVSDFSLNSLLAVGAKLNPVRLDASPLKNVADMEQSLARLDAHIERTQSNE